MPLEKSVRHSVVDHLRGCGLAGPHMLAQSEAMVGACTMRGTDYQDAIDEIRRKIFIMEVTQ